ncbi:MAG: chemotaxis protein CheW [Gammaproteobacteria bacterium]|jgi:twitching motility protein PilI|nr:chemotaxis protein CheW [Gammaproteobacteria bacterium]
MHYQQPDTPFEVLLAAKRAILSHAKSLPYHDTSVDNWVGVSFLTGQQVLLAQLEEVIEIMRVPDLAPVPGVKPWLLGMATCRGELFPVTDLSGFLTGKLSVLTLHSRILVIRYHEDYAGILVDRVLGLQRIASENQTKEWSSTLNELSPFIAGAFVNDHLELPIISCKAIMEHPQFRDVALREDEIPEVEE